MCEISLAGEILILLPERAAWWPSRKALILSDLHWGKSAHFRKAGIAMPLSTQQQDGVRLADIVRKTGAERLIIAGDLFHSRHNHEVSDFTYWRNAHPDLHIDFVVGNHDILPRATYQQLDMRIHAEGISIGPFYISHDAVEQPDAFVIHGHVHPGLTLPGPGRNTLPGFFITKTCMVLPAFGQFTGFYRLNPARYEHIYVIGDGKVMRCK